MSESCSESCNEIIKNKYVCRDCCRDCYFYISKCDIISKFLINDNTNDYDRYMKYKKEYVKKMLLTTKIKKVLE